MREKLFAMAKASVAEPAYERWVKQTDACQKPLPDAKGIWSAMDTIIPE